MQHLGIHVDAKKTRAVLVDVDGNEGRVVDAEEFDVPEGLFVDGEIASLPLLVSHFRTIRKRFGRVHTTICMHNRAATGAVVRIPDMPPEEIRQTLEFEMANYIRKGVLSDHVLGYMVINEEFAEADRNLSKHLGILAVAYPKVQITQILDCAKKARLNVSAVEIADVALWRSYSFRPELNFVYVHAGHGEVLVATSHRGNLHYIRPKTFVNSENVLGMRDEAYRTLVEELRRTLEYYADRTKTRADAVFVTSSDEVPGDFISSLSSDLGMAVKRWNVQREFVLNGKKIICDLPGSVVDETFAVALGLALRILDASDSSVDLVPKDYVRKNRISQIVKICFGTGAVLLALAGAFILHVHLLENKLSDLVTEREKYTARVDRAAQLQSEIASLKAEIERLEQTSSGGNRAVQESEYGIVLGDFLHFVEKNVPRDMKIHSMRYDSSSGTIRFRAIADSQQSIGAFLLLLEKFENVGEASVRQIRQYKFGNIVYLATEIEMKLSTGGAAR